MSVSSGMSGPLNPELARLRQRIRALESGGALPARILPFGAAAVDAALPGGGLALGALHEVLGAGPDEEDGAAAAGFAAAILGRLARRLGRPVLWCLSAAACDLYGPGLAAGGLAAAERLILARCRGEADILWAMEEGLRSAARPGCAAPALAAVVGEVGALPATAGRRLQLACEAGGLTAFVLRRWRNGTLAARHRAAPSAAVTRWRVAAAPSRDFDLPGLGVPLWQVELLRCRGGRPAAWLMEEGDATGHVAVAAALVDRPDQPARRRNAG